MNQTQTAPSTQTQMEDFFDMHVTRKGDKMSLGGRTHDIDYFREKGGHRYNAIVHDNTDIYKCLDLIQDEKEGYRIRGIESRIYSAVCDIIRFGPRERREPRERCHKPFCLKPGIGICWCMIK